MQVHKSRRMMEEAHRLLDQIKDRELEDFNLTVAIYGKIIHECGKAMVELATWTKDPQGLQVRWENHCRKVVKYCAGRLSRIMANLVAVDPASQCIPPEEPKVKSQQDEFKEAWSVYRSHYGG